jgi:hypothetical protein
MLIFGIQSFSSKCSINLWRGADGRASCGLENIDPHYKIIGYVSADAIENDGFQRQHFVKHIKEPTWLLL